MKLLAWNVGHRTRRKPLQAEIATALASARPDVIVLTEYVGQDSHKDFYDVLEAGGLGQHQSSAYVTGQNQVFIAARERITKGNVECCEIGSAAQPNWLHVRTNTGIDIVGFRVPMFGTEKRGAPRYWEWLSEKGLPPFFARPSVLLGDFNAAPTSKPLKRAVQAGWQLATPSTGWSFRGARGNTSAIDHGLVSPHFKIMSVDYVPALNGIALAGSTGAYSDHAALVMHLELTA